MIDALKIFFILIFLFIVFIFCFLFIGKERPAKEIQWGVVFSQKQAEGLGLDWKEVFLALLDDLKIKHIKIITHWDLIEPKKDAFEFSDLDWQVKEAQKRNAKVILVLGMKTGRWPECHLPFWAKDLKKEFQQEEILELIKKIVLRYKNYSHILYWQIENEPFFKFGECPQWWPQKSFLKKEIDLVRSLDKRKIIISDSGEFSFWITPAQLGDVVGITLHRIVYFKELGVYLKYPFTPIYYWRRVQLIKHLFGKKVICVELQAEPWGKTLLYWSPPFEQEKTMNLNQLRENIRFAKKTGLDVFYFWGGEWWYWLKEKQNKKEIWEEIKNLVKNF